MKLNVLPVLASLICSQLIPVYSFAGPGVSGGGDQCENRVKEIAFDISNWIRIGGSSNLKLPDNVAHDQYANSMLDQLRLAKVKCVGKGDVGFPVQINNTAKTCRFDKVGSASDITCDYEKFRGLTDEEQYVLVHHEFAGLAGIEPASGDDSHYQTSNQISAYLENTVVKKLAVKPAVDTKAVCAAQIQKFISAKFPFYLDQGVKQPIKKVDIDRVEFINATGLVEIEAHAFFDEDGFSAIRVFVSGNGIWKNSSAEPVPSGCSNLQVKTSYFDPVAE